MTHRTANPGTPPIETRLCARIPGPDRKRSWKWYDYRIVYHNRTDPRPGCVLIWRVEGGREVYQVALERTEQDQLRWHCTCADCVYRQDRDPHHQCKHVHGATQLYRQMQ